MPRPFSSYFLWGRGTTGSEVQTHTLELEKSHRTPPPLPRSAKNPQLRLETLEVASRDALPQQKKPWRRAKTTTTSSSSNLGEAPRRISTGLSRRRPHDDDHLAPRLHECFAIEDDLRAAGRRLDDCAGRLDQMHGSAVRVRRELEDLRAALASLAARRELSVSEEREVVEVKVVEEDQTRRCAEGQPKQQQQEEEEEVPRPDSPETKTLPPPPRVRSSPRVELTVQVELPAQVEPPVQVDTTPETETARGDAPDTTPSSNITTTTIIIMPDTAPPRPATPHTARPNKVTERFPLQPPPPLPETVGERWSPVRPRTPSGKVQDQIQFWSKMQQT